RRTGPGARGRRRPRVALDADRLADRGSVAAARGHPGLAAGRGPGGGRGLAVPERAAMSPPRRPRPSRGFTLLEVMAALAIFGLIAAAGVGVMAHAADSQGILRARMDRLGEFQRAR